MNLPKSLAKIPIIEIPIEKSSRLFIKREDLIHPEISGNKYWKLFFNVNEYLKDKPLNPIIITFGGAYSNHAAATAAFGGEFGVKTLGMIRGEELAANFRPNPTLEKAARHGMILRFVSRAEYGNKEIIIENLKKEFPEALIIPEGGTNKLAVEGVKFMLDEETRQFNYLCCAVGTGGTLAGISKFAENKQKILGFKVVRDASLENKIFDLSGKRNFELIDASERGYGKISDAAVRFINDFHRKFRVPLDPIYTGKALGKIFELLETDYFPPKSKILFFHTGGLQGIFGANEMLKRQKRNLIEF